MNSFSSLIGQEQAVELLQQGIHQKRIAPAYLFVGPSGTGRSLAAQCFSQQLLCLGLSPQQQATTCKRIADRNHPDLLWVQPTYQYQGRLIGVKEADTLELKRKSPPQIRIEQVRDLTHFLSCPPLESSRSIAIIEEAQMMTESAANALLKTLEEPGRGTLILIAPIRDSLLPTILSRCQQISFYRLSQAKMEILLRKEGYEEIFNYPELLGIAQGSPGAAIAAIAQLKAIPEELHQQLINLPKNRLQALKIAKTIEGELDTQSQLWLIDYLQYFYWQNFQQKHLLAVLEKARQYLLSYVQPRLVWECTLLAFWEVGTQ